ALFLTISYSKIMTAKTIGTKSVILGNIPYETSTFKVPVHALNTQCTISILSDAPLPLALVGLIWRGVFIQKTRGV
ncbi:hypothetical protein, partial [Pectinatus frisingensis]|uniref:phage nozzle protein n=1 Tax=Pectinatus frisingensis TaxID=865 RepID=UPI0018C74116